MFSRYLPFGDGDPFNLITPPTPPPPKKKKPPKKTKNFTTFFYSISIPLLLHGNFLIFHDHLSAQMLHSQHFTEKVRKYRPSKPMLNSLMSAGHTFNTIQGQTLVKIPNSSCSMIFPRPFTFSRFSSLCGKTPF